MAIATSMATIVFTSISSVRAHHARGAVRWDLVRGLAPGIVAGGLLAGLRRPYAFAAAPWWMLMNGVSGPALGVACYQWALTRHDAALVLSVVALTPLIVLLMQWAIEGRRPSWRLWVGGAIAIVGVILLRTR